MLAIGCLFLYINNTILNILGMLVPAVIGAALTCRPTKIKIKISNEKGLTNFIFYSTSLYYVCFAKIT